MNFEDYTSYFGLVLILILVYLICKVFLNNYKREGFLGIFENSDDSTDDSTDDDKSESTEDDPAVQRLQANIDSLVDATKKTTDQMNLVKYRKQWEDLIIAMEDRISSTSLQSANVLAAMMKTNPNDPNIVSICTKLNQFNQYRETLQQNMKYLDGLN
jgi:hypothetical protein